MEVIQMTQYQSYQESQAVCDGHLIEHGTSKEFRIFRVWKQGRDAYDVWVGQELRHPRLDPEGVMRILAHYLESLSGRYSK